MVPNLTEMTDAKNLSSISCYTSTTKNPRCRLRDQCTSTWLSKLWAVTHFNSAHKDIRPI